MAASARDRPIPARARTEHLRDSPPMFASRALDRLTRVHVAVVPAVFVPIVVVQLIVAFGADPSAATAAWLLAGYLAWTLTEYWLHRTVFHFAPEGGVGARLHWMLHGVHHDHPNDPLRLVMPPAASIPLAAGFVALFQLALPLGAACTLGAGFFTGYLAYDLTHFYIHHGRPRNTLGRRLREHHLRHHFSDDSTAFGVSAALWDHVFGTAPKPGGAECRLTSEGSTPNGTRRGGGGQNVRS